MDEKEFKPIAKQIFTKITGLELQDIEVSTKKHGMTPDFKSIGKKNSFLIELKIKEDDPAELTSIKEELKTGSIVSRVTLTGRRNKLYSIIKKGVKQLHSYDQDREYSHLLWIHCSGNDSELHHDRFKATLFGTQDLFSLDIDPIITCYYFHDSSFFRYRDDLEGVIVSRGSVVTLYINSLATRVNTFRLSELTEAFRRKRGLHDPDTYSEDADFMMVDSDIDRKNKNEVLNYLMKKYKLNYLQPIDLKKHEGFLSIKDNT